MFRKDLITLVHKMFPGFGHSLRITNTIVPVFYHGKGTVLERETGICGGNERNS